jgi:endonuclease YncB( thermonuclease family)
MASEPPMTTSTKTAREAPTITAAATTFPRTPLAAPAAVLMLLLPLLGVGCASTREGRRFTRGEIEKRLQRLEIVGLDLGDFPIDGASGVLDGDTLLVRGLSSTLRLLALDTEETFKHERERKLFEGGWVSYKRAMRGDSTRPVKFPTPLGEEAKAFAQRYFEGVSEVRLERDHPGEIRDFDGRYLVYAWAKKHGQWQNFNLECVRAGYSPYFTKYGRSRRFHKAFLEAQQDARSAQRGIWQPGAMHYDDYDERLRWWNEREGVITRFEREAEEFPETWMALTRWDTLLRLEAKVGQEVVLLGAVKDVRLAEHGPSVVKLSRTLDRDLDVVFFDKDVLLSTGLQFKRGEFVRIRGMVQKYKPASGEERLQLRVSLPGQVLAPSRELEALLGNEAGSNTDPSYREAE